jgi:hypothetical protein
MSFWEINEKGKKEFRAGLEAFSAAEEASLNCLDFRLDDEDELVTDQDWSCYNCRYRRWTTDSFVCLKN